MSLLFMLRLTINLLFFYSPLMFLFTFLHASSSFLDPDIDCWQIDRRTQSPTILHTLGMYLNLDRTLLPYLWVLSSGLLCFLYFVPWVLCVCIVCVLVF